AVQYFENSTTMSARVKFMILLALVLVVIFALTEARTIEDKFADLEELSSDEQAYGKAFDRLMNPLQQRKLDILLKKEDVAHNLV
ncbi:unnamed protein product, partial [Allacma fusca]